MRKNHLILVLLIFLYGGVLKAQTYKELYDKSIDYIDMDSLDLAIKTIDLAIKTEPENQRNALLYSNLGFIYRKKNDLDKAAECYTKALAILPKTLTILLSRASVYLDMNQTQKAYEDCCTVIDEDFNNKIARTMRASIYMSQRNYDDARIDYKNILSHYPNDYSSMMGIAIIEQKNRNYDRAINIVDILLKDHSDDIDLLIVKAEIEYERKNTLLAIDYCNKVLSKEKNNVNALILRIKINKYRNNKSMVSRDIKQLISLGVGMSEIKELINN